VTSYYLRLRVEDKPLVLGHIATVFGHHDVSLAAMEMRTLNAGAGEIVFLTHPCVERNFQAALTELREEDIVQSVGNAFRVAD